MNRIFPILNTILRLIFHAIIVIILLLFGTENGIEVSEDLENVTENAINKFGFNFGEESRVKKLLHLGTYDYLGLLQTIIECMHIYYLGSAIFFLVRAKCIVGADSLQEGTCKHSMH